MDMKGKQLTVGDRVKVWSDGSYGQKRGEIGTIQTIEGNRAEIKIPNLRAFFVAVEVLEFVESVEDFLIREAQMLAADQPAIDRAMNTWYPQS